MPKVLLVFPSLSISKILFDKSSTLPDSTRNPVLLLSTISIVPPTLEAITGFLGTLLQLMLDQKLSKKITGLTIKLDRYIKSGISSLNPSNFTLSLTLSLLIRD